MWGGERPGPVFRLVADMNAAHSVCTAQSRWASCPNIMSHVCFSKVEIKNRSMPHTSCKVLQLKNIQLPTVIFSLKAILWSVSGTLFGLLIMASVWCLNDISTRSGHQRCIVAIPGVHIIPQQREKQPPLTTKAFSVMFSNNTSALHFHTEK